MVQAIEPQALCIDEPCGFILPVFYSALRTRHWGSFCFGELLEASTTDGLAEFGDSAGFDLADALPGDAEETSHFIERLRVTIPQTVTQFDHFPFPLGQGAKHLGNPFAE